MTPVPNLETKKNKLGKEHYKAKVSAKLHQEAKYGAVEKKSRTFKEIWADSQAKSNAYNREHPVMNFVSLIIFVILIILICEGQLKWYWAICINLFLGQLIKYLVIKFSEGKE